ncbi:helix-turn-helix transcriptional regulator [Neolewinella antarctica]|nr:AraC family transcriptional regulator [Neolewinella antarctica]
MEDARVLELKRSDATEMVAEMARLLQLPLQLDCQKGFMELRDPVGTGKVMCYHTDKGLDTIIFNCELRVPIELKLRGNFSQPIFFYTAARGAVDVSCQRGDFTVKDLQATVHGAYGGDEYSIRLPAGEEILLMVSLVHRKVFFEKVECEILQIPPQLLRVVKGDEPDQDHFLFQDIYHLPAVDAVYSIIDHQEVGLLHSAHASAMIFENLFLLLNEYKRIHKSTNGRLVKEVNKINLIRAAEKVLIANLHDCPTIPNLARMVGVNQQTLKKGFRQLYGTTINGYLNDHRLNQASLLINGGNMSIAEVADAVGYSNGGYFSRKFKQKYGVPPSKFGSG